MTIFLMTSRIIYRLRARTDYKPLGSKGVANLVKLLEKLPNLGELRYVVYFKQSIFMVLCTKILDSMETNSRLRLSVILQYQ